MTREEAISFLSQERLLQYCKGKFNVVDAIDQALSDMEAMEKLSEIYERSK